MFAGNTITHAVFIGGGGDNSLVEFELLKELQPDTKIISIVSTAGATIEIACRLNLVSNDLKRKDRFIKLFFDELEIDVGEPRRKYPLPTPQTMPSLS